MIEITGCDFVKLVQTAYDLSQPRGLGILHYEEGPLSDEEAKKLIHDGNTPVSMDYVKGRAVKMVVFREGEKLFIADPWFDHTPNQLRTLLSRIGVVPKPLRRME